MTKKLFQNPMSIYLLFAFLIFSWPFINFPFTDGDIGNWTWVAKDVQLTNNFFSGPNDQTHGPLMAWTAGILTKFTPQSFYFYGLFTILCGVFGTGLTYFFSQKIWENTSLSKLNTFLFCTAIAPVYLSRTPMYDWPAAIFYFMFCGFYILYLKEGKSQHYWVSLLAVAIGSLARFSICTGLAGIFMIIANLIYKRSFVSIIRDGIAILMSCVLINLPWLIGQTKTHGDAFLSHFIYDNLGRFIKSTRVDAYVRKDYYGFILYTIVGILPYSFCLLNTVFQKKLWPRIKSDTMTQLLCAGFIPCLLIFSFSGHTKLARYISYVFPMLSLFLGSQMYLYDLKNASYRKRCSLMMIILGVLIGTILVIQILLFPEEVKESLLFTFSIIGLIFGLLISIYWIVTKRFNEFLNNATPYLTPFGIIYVVFFSILTYESLHADFLRSVRESVLRSIQ